VVGGPPDNLGWGEFILDESGFLVGSTAQFYEDENGNRPEWLRTADKEFRGYDLNWAE
jgi:hypothetical protein